MNVIEVAVRAEVVSATFIGASGTVKMTAPLPWIELNESPYALNALTFAQTDEPQGS